MPKFPQYAFSYDVHELIAYRQTALPSVCPAFYPRSNVCLFVPVAAYDHLSLRPCIRMSPSVCYCSRIWSSVCPTLYLHVTVCSPLFPRMIVSLSVLLAAYYHGEFDVSEPNQEIHFGALCTHGSQLIMQMYYATYSRVWHKICNSRTLRDHWTVGLIQSNFSNPTLQVITFLRLAVILSDCYHLSFHPSVGKFQLRIHRADFQKTIC